MSDQNPISNATTSTNAYTQQNQQQQPQVVVIRESAPSSDTKESGDEFRNMSSQQFKQRLEEAKESGVKSLLKELGIEKKDRKSALEEIKAGRMSLSKKEQELAAAKAEAEALKPQAAQASDRVSLLEAELKSYADEQFAALPESVQKFLAATAPDDPAARLKSIRAAKEAGLLTPATTAKENKPANTMADGGPQSPKPAAVLNHFEKWSELKAAGQTILAARYYDTFAKSIDASTPKK